MSKILLDDKFFGDQLKEGIQEIYSEAKASLGALIEKDCSGSEWLGWWNYPQNKGYEVAKEIHEFKQKYDTIYDLVLVIGIGGSYLGTRAVTEALQHSYNGMVRESGGAKQPMIAFAGHHLSERSLGDLLDLLDDRLPVVNVVSKSGTTTEPSVAFRFIRNYLTDRFGKEEAARRIVVTTDNEKGALRSLAQQEGYQSFPIPDDIGGRFSVLSPVGLLPLALAGVNINDLLDGADAVFSELLKPELDHNPVLMYAALRTLAYRSGKKVEILSYAEPKLSFMVEWWKQLFGESEGKDHKGLFPAGMAFTTDLHSLGQYAQDGERILLETFLKFERNSGQKAVEKRISRLG